MWTLGRARGPDPEHCKGEGGGMRGGPILAVPSQATGVQRQVGPHEGGIPPSESGKRSGPPGPGIILAPGLHPSRCKQLGTPPRALLFSGGTGCASAVFEVWAQADAAASAVAIRLPLLLSSEIPASVTLLGVKQHPPHASL